jgi:hypothetical protein
METSIMETLQRDKTNLTKVIMEETIPVITLVSHMQHKMFIITMLAMTLEVVTLNNDILHLITGQL